MARISGQFRAGSPPLPTITALVTIPRLRKERPVEFLIDTGADATTLHPIDTRLMGIRPLNFVGIPRALMYGVGGNAQYWEEMAELRFLHDDGDYWDVVTLPIHVAVPTRANSAIESLLGRDVIGLYRFTCESLAGILTFE
jgi:hypothetical protein